jgi:predicted nuclease with TOPRIM domain
MSHDFIQNAVNALYQSNELMALKGELANLKAKADQSEAENARLKAEVERLTDKIRVSDNHAQCLEFVIKAGTANELRLQAQVERLTKAGDALAGEAIRLEYNNYWSEYEKVEDVCIDEVEAWHKAKGVQS